MIHDNDNTLPTEEWRPVPSIPDIEASSHGRIRRKPYTGAMPNGGIRVYEATPRFGSICQSSREARSLFFIVRYSGIGNIKVHFAVCEAFHGRNTDGRNGVRHLNENGLDNRPENLCWASQKVNMNDPSFKSYLKRRISQRARSNLSAREKRAGIYDSILDLGMRLKASNDNRNNERKAA